MLDVFNIAKPQNCDIQIFYGAGSAGGTVKQSWMKPRGVSHVYILLIGPGGDGSAGTAGGSGIVTVWYGAAQNVPDYLGINVSTASATQIRGQFSNSNPVTLLSANTGGNGGGGSSAMGANQFAASGFFQSVASQAGSASTQTPSSTTFLNGGAGSAASCTGQYGYTNNSSTGAGFFMLQPIIVGVGGSGAARGGIGCGGGGNAGVGGPGMVLIASW